MEDLKLDNSKDKNFYVYNIFDTSSSWKTYNDTIKELSDTIAEHINKEIFKSLKKYMTKRSDYRVGAILVDSRGRTFLHDGFVTADGLCMICQYDPKEDTFLWSTGRGNFCNGCDDFRVATVPEIEDFFDKMMSRDKVFY